MAVSHNNINRDLAELRFRPLGDGILLTNDLGRWLFVSKEEFEAVLNGGDALDPELRKRLDQKGFLKTRGYVGRAVNVLRQRNEFLEAGPNLHIMILTLRCNYTCLYCHASREPMSSTEFDMPIERAKRVVDTIFQTSSRAINIEFQGGEPLVAWDVLEAVVLYAENKNKEIGKDLAFTLVTNLSLMDEKKLAFLLDHNVYVCTSIDGPSELHERNRLFGGGSSYDMTVRWIDRFHEAYIKRGYDLDLFHVDALMTTTAYSLPLHKEIVDEYVKLGLKSIHMRPLNPFGFVQKTWDKIGYSAEQFAEFYNRSLDYILELNGKGVELIERMAAIYLTRILTDRDPNYMELRSPCGAGIGQIAYNYDGQVFTCDEGRMMAQMGDDIFRMGDVEKDEYSQLMESDAVRTLVLASVQDGIPHCATCVYKPYCGVCPIYNYATQGDLFGQMPNNGRCKLAMAGFDRLFTLLKQGDEQIDSIFEKWTTTRVRQIDACDPC